MRGYISLLDSPLGNPCTQQYTPAGFVSECFNSTFHRGVLGRGARIARQGEPFSSGRRKGGVAPVPTCREPRRKGGFPSSVRPAPLRGERSRLGVGAPGTSRLSESSSRVKLIVPNALEWRNWQTQQTQNLPPVTRHGGSTPPSSIWLLKLDGRPSQHVILRSPRPKVRRS
jgi:hypothetical protein